MGRSIKYWAFKLQNSLFDALSRYRWEQGRVEALIREIQEEAYKQGLIAGKIELQRTIGRKMVGE